MRTMTITELYQLRDRVRAGDMTQKVWDTLSLDQREFCRDLSSLSPQLIGLEGWRVAVIRGKGDGPSAVSRFIVGKSTGWVPCHLEIKTRRSHGGQPAQMQYFQVTKLEKVR